MQCAGGPNGDACIMRCRNSAIAGPFGSCVAVTNANSANSTATTTTAAAETTTAAVTTPEACDGRDLNAIPTSTGSRDARSTVPITTGSVASFIEGLRALAASYNELSPRSREVVRNAIMKVPVDVQDAISPTATAQGVSTECTPYVHHEKVTIMS